MASEEINKLKKEIEQLKEKNEAKMDNPIHPTWLQNRKLEQEINNIKRSYEILKSEFQQKRDALQQHNEILMKELCGSPDDEDDEKDKYIEQLEENIAQQQIEIQELKVKNTSIETLEGCNHTQKLRIEELEERSQFWTDGMRELFKLSEGPCECGFLARAEFSMEAGSVTCVLTEHFAFQEEEIKKLKEENKKLKEEIKD